MSGIIESLKNYSTQNMQLLWKKTENGARIDRVFSQEIFLKLPDYIEGSPVTELGPYCFSSTIKDSFKDNHLTFIDGNDEYRILEPCMPELAGKYLEGLVLPDSLKILGNGVFYGCRSLKYLSFGTSVHSLGSDIFTNCLNLTHINIRGYAEEKTILPSILERIKTEIEATFHPKKSEVHCRLFFPECYEWFDDMITAHVFNRVMVGEGFRMRQCFHDHILQFNKYDQCFAGSLKLEGDREICEIAMNRLRWPISLSEEYETVYKKALKDRYDMVIHLIISKKDLEGLKFICEILKPDECYLTKWMENCIHKDWIEGNVYLMEIKHNGSSFLDKSFDFDDF